MCMSCGCNRPNERHGDNRNIIMQDLQEAATVAEISTAEAVKNIQRTFEAVGPTNGQREAVGRKVR